MDGALNAVPSAASAPIWRGCIFCRSGKEDDVLAKFAFSYPDGRAIAPTKTRYRRRDDAAIEERVRLLPGYVFLEFAAQPEREEQLDRSLRAFCRSDSVFRLLRYSDGEWRLQGADELFARALFEADGNIGISGAYFDEGNRIRILDGFLKDHEASIIRVNKRRKTVEASVDFHGKKVNMWLGYELVTKV